MAHYNFDERNINWYQLDGVEHLRLRILDIDEQNMIIDAILKFEPHKPILLHRHCALNKTFVIQGEHRLYHANGNINEIRSTGTYTSSPASSEPHRECGGDEGAVVLFSIRAKDDVLYEILDERLNLLGTLTMQDFVALYNAH